MERLDTGTEFSELESLESSIELPEDSGEKLFQVELPDDSGEVIPQTELPDDSGEVIPQTELPESLTMEEKIEKQDLEIQAVESGEKSLDRGNTKETGNYGEMKTDQFLRSIGYERVSMNMITDIDEGGHHGIDGIYYHAETDQYLIVDAKYGSSQLNPETRDGKQMSANWINQRLDGDLGKEKADSIRLKMLLEPEKVISAVAHVSADGTVKFDMLDEAANVVKKDINITEKGVMVNG
ncbi:MAG: hypothetical protein LUI39_03355 [Lachnospiraceae bacterium]|nr:hypothetical protein [Lachnospiraceae bacterium]